MRACFPRTHPLRVAARNSNPGRGRTGSNRHSTGEKRHPMRGTKQESRHRLNRHRIIRRRRGTPIQPRRMRSDRLTDERHEIQHHETRLRLLTLQLTLIPNKPWQSQTTRRLRKQNPSALRQDIARRIHIAINHATARRARIHTIRQRELIRTTETMIALMTQLGRREKPAHANEILPTLHQLTTQHRNERAPAIIARRLPQFIPATPLTAVCNLLHAQMLDTHVIIRISNQRRQLLQKITTTISDLLLPTSKGRLRAPIILRLDRDAVLTRKTIPLTGEFTGSACDEFLVFSVPVLISRGSVEVPVVRGGGEFDDELVGGSSLIVDEEVWA